MTCRYLDTLKKEPIRTEPNNIVSVRQTEFDIIYIFDKTDFIGAKINGNYFYIFIE